MVFQLVPGHYLCGMSPLPLSFGRLLATTKQRIGPPVLAPKEAEKNYWPSFGRPAETFSFVGANLSRSSGSLTNQTDILINLNNNPTFGPPSVQRNHKPEAIL